MQEGLSLYLSGATLLTVLGMAIKIWLATRSQKIGPQPFRITADEPPQSRSACIALHEKNEADHSNLFARLSAVEVASSAHRATQAAMSDTIKSMDTKLDKLIARR